MEAEALKRLSFSFIITNLKGYILFYEKAVDVKWPPNVKGAERPEKGTDKSGLSINELNMGHTELGGERQQDTQISTSFSP